MSNLKDKTTFVTIKLQIKSPPRWRGGLGHGYGAGVDMGTEKMPGRFGVMPGVVGVGIAGIDRYVIWSAS